MMLTPQADLAVAQALLALRDERDRLRKEVERLRSAVKLLDAAAGPYCAPELRPVLIAEARAALGEDAP